MKRILTLLAICSTMFLSSCDVLKQVAGTFLTEQDAINGIKEMLTIGANGNALISKETLMGAILPSEVNTVLQKIGRAHV